LYYKGLLKNNSPKIRTELFLFNKKTPPSILNSPKGPDLMAKKSPKSPTPVLATKHKDKRANIPTEELRDFVADDEKAPKNILYPRDPSLDPQLVWQGKDEQDRHPLEVPAVPIYIQEKIHPQVIVENLRETAKAGKKEQPLELFGDFNGIKFEQLIEFYQHKDGVNWANRMILPATPTRSCSTTSLTKTTNAFVLPARSRWKAFRRIVSFRRMRTATARFPNRKPASIMISPQ
jgi:hypothetical protein